MTLTSQQVREPLDEYSEGLISLSFNGYLFREHAASKLLTRYGCWGEARYWMLMAALARQDRETARIYLHDWPHLDRQPKANISRFIPGQHWYALDTKFSTFEEAMQHLRRRGYAYGGTVEKYVPREGD